MKELEIKPQDKLEISVQQKKQIEKKLIGDIVPNNGHKIWKINEETMEVEEAKYLNNAFIVGTENKKEILITNGFFYVSALNKKNALKLYRKGKVGGKDIDKDPLKLAY